MLPDSQTLSELSKTPVLLSQAYIAPVEYYAILARCADVRLEQHEFYIKQSYRNRCRIATANGTMELAIPIVSAGVKVPMKDVRISPHGDWQAHHWKSMASAYQSSPFFEYYADDFHKLYLQQWDFLWDFNEALHQLMLELLDIQPVIKLSSIYQSEWEGVVDLRDRIHPKKKNIVHDAPEYYQVFRSKWGFRSGLSIIDLLMNMGNESILVLNSFYSD